MPTNDLTKILHKLTRLELSTSEASALNQQLGSVSDWDKFVSEVELNGMPGIVLSHINKHELSVPKNVRVQLHALRMRHKAVMAVRYKTLCEIDEVLTANNIPMIVLKGAALATILYEDISLRSMRDVDVLVAKSQIYEAADLFRSIGFSIPQDQPSRYMRNTHQLPDATKQVDGFLISVELHHDAISRDIKGHMSFEQAQLKTQQYQWQDLTLTTLGHEQMLHQLCRHLQSLHPGALLKLINVLDVVAYSEKFCDQIDWAEIQKSYQHVINTLHCLHLIVPLSEQLQAKIGAVSEIKEIQGIGETMQSPKHIFSKKNSLAKRLMLSFSPPDWWLHVYYGVHPSKSLIWVKLFGHPLNLITWFSTRVFSGLLGG